MFEPGWNPLVGVSSYPAERYAVLADRIGAILHSRDDILLVQAEAVVALEAVAASLARPGLSALNIVTSPYGGWFGRWLRRSGAEVADVVAEPGLPVEIEAVARALDAAPGVDVLALVHAESASGILNPLPEILALARARGIVTVVDAVASVGGHEVDVDELGIDIAVIGPQKALGGPAGVSALSVSGRAWDLILHDGAPRDSILSLADLKSWVDGGRRSLPGTPAPLEFFALEAALDRIKAEGMENVVARHALAASATQAGLTALGAAAWVPAAKASNLVTAVPVPEALTPDALIAAAGRLGVELTEGVGTAPARLVRLNHTGPRASFQTVLSNVVAYGAALRQAGHPCDIAAAAEAISAVYSR
ncbi:serine-pyruvate aminotransferase/archaeal aspartate aminotransferase [Rhizobium leguminosarum bv. trifolii WSM2297]|uniref:Serine-pyruvate aminotransferase/archaeal aspartate aminotransferase n=1 Tax=Rhizobium leguminosarum bv. trifolii WSM2297 TaxID=754762 RepID=J0WGD1_RHILT|nr:aminotransferase class V-fold PLP-dependent enzyme [Rhizobium leguminosarum]EJC83926.1 serine-pyruvate aminotransferase/archaeal aspartate aminotransferase [Rhizobium leguminosarum bv. trifolii WSM2297]EJC84483.1 serine-pyruvate aminotransferase/archaeal aspartate aminotransferase [Rhizobium leguminosarum bv. trifolii WSM2297]